MHLQYIPYIWLLLASAMISAALGVYAWRQRAVTGAAAFAVLMGLATLWTLANGLEMAGTDLPTKLFWANVQYLCYTTIPVTWLVLALQISGRGEWLTRRNLARLMVMPVIIVALVWTDNVHGLMRRNVSLDTIGPFPVISKTAGPGFWLNVAYGYTLFMVTIFLLLRIIRQAPSLYRRQAVPVLISLLLPLTSSALYNFGLSPISRHDISPAVFSLSGLIVAWGLFRFHLFDIMPVARARVVDGMDDGVIVLDVKNRIVDLNPVALTILGWSLSQTIGRPAAEVFGSWPDLLTLGRDAAVTRIESSLGVGQAQRHYVLLASPLADRHDRPVGRLIVLRDITARKQAEAQLLQQQRALAVLEERGRLARELHDDLGQVLGYVNVQAQAIHELLATGQTATADAHLARLTTIAQDAQADVREYILSLKAVISPELGFFLALEQYLGQFEQNSGIHTEMIVPETLAEGALDPVVEVQLLRIIQEALANVRKHAAAHRVQVSFAVQGDQAQVMIEDDGHGFDSTTLGDDTQYATRNTQNFGLRFMRERAEAVGGSLQVHSTPGRGTKVIVQVPLGEEGGEKPMRVLLVDDHPLFLEGLQNLLVARGIEVVGTAGDGLEALEKARALRPDLILMDIQMPRCDGLAATRLIKAEMPEVKIVMLTVSEADADLFEAIKSGASGYLLKSLDAGEFFGLLSGLARGEAPLSPGMAARILEEFARTRGLEATTSVGGEDTEGLTPRQMEVLTLVARGMTYKEVAATLHLSERTIKYHMGEIVNRLHLENRAQVIAWAARIGLVRDDQPIGTPPAG